MAETKTTRNWYNPMSWGRGTELAVVNNEVDPASDTETNTYSADGALVATSNVTLNQLLDALNGLDGEGLFGGLYKPTLYGRNSAICFTTLSRAILLQTGIFGSLVGSGHYRIVNDDGSTNDSPKAKALRYVFSNSLNGRQPASYTLQDMFADYLLDGNSLGIIETNNRGVVKAIHRGIVWSATVVDRKSTYDVYSIEDAEWRDGYFHQVRSDRIIHARMPHLGRNRNLNKLNFALAPVQLMRPVLKSGLAVDQYVRKFAERAPYQQLAFSFDQVTDGDKKLSPDLKEKMREHIQAELVKERGYAMNVKSSVTDVTAKISPELVSRAEYSAMEVGKFYGIPAPLIGVNITQWGQGIAELGRLAKTYGFALHIQNFLDAVAFKCLPPGCHIEVDYTKLFTGDPKGIKEFIDAVGGNSHRPAIASIEEMRKHANLPAEVEGTIVNIQPDGTKETDGNSEDDMPEGEIVEDELEQKLLS